MRGEEQMNKDVEAISQIILEAKAKAFRETTDEPEPELTKKIAWPVSCTVGPGLEGAIACETEVGYVNGSKGWLIYRGYNIFDLCAYSTFEEVAFLLINGFLPDESQLATFKSKMAENRHLIATQRLVMGFPVEEISPMAALRLGTLFMRQKQTFRDVDEVEFKADAIAADEDSIAMETTPLGDRHATYEFKRMQTKRPRKGDSSLLSAESLESCYSLLSGVATICAAIARLRQGKLPIEPKPELSHAANLLYMITGKEPTPVEERIMDICLILHADHGMNASTFAAMVVASTLSDIYFSVGSGIAALNGPLHGGANEQVMKMLKEIGAASKVEGWLKKQMASKQKVMGFGHRVYKAYDPRARILGPLAKILVKAHPEMANLFATATALEKQVLKSFGKEKNIFPNVDYYSGFVYNSLGVSEDFFTPLFAVARVAGWTARVFEYLQKNRIFRPRAMYVGKFDNEYVPIENRE